MQLRYALIADFANVTQDGKLNVMGAFDRLFAPRFPALHRQLFLITSFESDPEDNRATRQMRVQLIDADGNVVTKTGGALQLGEGKQIVNQLHVFTDLKFPAAGSYEFGIFCDDVLLKSVPLDLIELPPAETVSG